MSVNQTLGVMQTSHQSQREHHYLRVYNVPKELREQHKIGCLEYPGYERTNHETGGVK